MFEEREGEVVDGEGGVRGGALDLEGGVAAAGGGGEGEGGGGGGEGWTWGGGLEV